MERHGFGPCGAVRGEERFLINWNFKHIVHFDKIAGFNAVNIRLGYKALSIFSPKEVVEA